RGVLTEAVPRDERRLDAARGQHPLRGDADGENRRLCVLRQDEVFVRAVEDDPGESRKRRFRLVKRGARLRVRVRQRPPHSDFLRSLSWKDECDQWCATCAAAISCSTRPVKWSDTNRCAIAMAFSNIA